MKRLSPIDAAFLRMESTRTPMHVGCMLTFRLPDNAPEDYFRVLVDRLRNEPFLPEPFNCRLQHTGLSALLPGWVEVDDLDMEYHVRHSALPRPGGERELGVLVSRLHSHPLDFDRPLWEMHIIEGLEGNRFAFYFKAHHCAIDGMGAMIMTRKWLKTDPNDLSSMGQVKLAPDPKVKAKHRSQQLRVAAALALRKAGGLGELAGKLVGMSRGKDSMVRASMDTPKSLFNVPVSQQRRLGTQLLELARFKAVADAQGVSVNDAILAVCGGATRKYLLEQDALPKTSLMASVPIGLERSEQGGNAVAGFVCPLGTDEASPVRRLQNINAATKRAKADLQAMSRPALDNLALTGLAPLILGQMTGTLAKIPPIFNFVVSNVVLTKHKLYLMGAELEAMYPMSFLFDGYALNVTAIGYADHVAIGFIGSRDALPKLQSLAVYAGEALSDLEDRVGKLTQSKKKAPSKRKTAAARPKKKPK